MSFLFLQSIPFQIHQFLACRLYRYILILKDQREVRNECVLISSCRQRVRKFLNVFIICNYQQQNIDILKSRMKDESRTVFNSIINDPKLLPLSTFKSNKFSKYNLFPQAHSLPPFFENNLQSDGRVVKYLKGPQGPLRAFYYQLFKLGFQIDNHTTDYASIIKNTIFDPILCSYSNSTSPSSGKQYNINQYKRIIAEYIKLMQSQVIPNAQLTFNQYPIIDQAMLTILELIIEKVIGDVYGKIENLFQLLSSLCQIFGITLQVYDSCYSFAESDVFLYVQGRDSCYLAFLSEMAEVESYEKTSESQEFKEQSSNSYIESKQEAGIYKDIRLSAGNRGARARPLNRSVPTGKNVYGTSSFGENGRRSRRTFKDEKQISQKQQGRDNDQDHNHDHDELEIQNDRESGLQKNVFESGSIDGEEQDRKQDSDYNVKINGQRNRLQQIFDAQKVQSKQIIKNISELQHKGSYKSLSSNPQPIPIASLHNIQSQPYQNKQVSNIYDVKTYKTITDSDLFDKRHHHQNIHQHNIQSLAHNNLNKQKNNITKSKSIKQKIEGQYNQLSMKKKAKVKIDDQIFQYEFKSDKYKKNKQEDIKLSNIVDKILDRSAITKVESSQNIQNKKQDKIDISTSKPSSTQTRQLTSPVQQNIMEKEDVYQNNRKDQLQTYLQPNLINSPMKTSSNVRTQPSRHTAPSSTELQFDQYNHILSPNPSHNPTIFVYQTPPSPPRNPQRNDVDFYTPKPGSLNLNIDVMNLLKKSENNYKVKENYGKKIGEGDETLGTFYREFTDTRVMEAMTEPFKTKVRNTRQKFKGVRSKNFKEFY